MKNSNIRTTTIVGWALSFFGCLAIAIMMESVLLVLLVIAVSSALLTVLNRLEDIRRRQERLDERLEEIYEILKYNDRRGEDSQVPLKRCAKCNARYSGEACALCT